MKLTKICIKNFKSIQAIEFDIKKYSTSYTTMLLGINESGKSNILEAMSYMDTPEGLFSYKETRNKKDKKNSYVDLYFYLEFEQQNTYTDFFRKRIKNGELLNFEISSLSKNVYLGHDHDKFHETYNYEIKNLSSGLFLKQENKTELVNGNYQDIPYYELYSTNNNGSLKELTSEVFEECFGSWVEEIAKIHEPRVSFWKTSDEYLISSVDLNKFSLDPNINKPLKNIFALSEYKTKEDIKKIITSIKGDDSARKSLMKELIKNTNKYINSKWKGHKIKFDIEIPEDQNSIKVFILDDGEENETVVFNMTARSEGFKQYISLLLSLSVENATAIRSNELILIDEPEAHLHPSGIRELREELLEIGKNNYLFVSTHSPFLVDRKTPERNIIIRKNEKAITEKKEILHQNDIRDDEVLDEAFGISVYKDLLNPHNILVEGCSDKTILQKAFKVKLYSFGITNGTGSNIVGTASRFNYDDIKILILVDDDNKGKEYKQKILKLGGAYSLSNVFTIRDLVGSIKNNGTIEDVLGKDFIESQVKQFYRQKFSRDLEITLLDSDPFIDQIKASLHQINEYSDDFMEGFKIYVSDKFDPKKTSFSSNFPLLNDLVEQIKAKLS